MAVKKQTTAAQPKNGHRALASKEEAKTGKVSIEARIDSLLDFADNKTKAVASVNIGGIFAIHKIRIMDSKNGLFVAMPSYGYVDAQGEKQFKSYCHPITAEARIELISKVMGAYEQALVEQQNMQDGTAEDISEAELQSAAQQM
ncbi:MAG: SpoVG family protein [Clostridium sp.]|nr:SpoVG family protein [Clostridium sp.]